MKKTISTFYKAIFITAIILFIFGCLSTFILYKTATYAKDTYALLQTATILVDYLYSNNNNWPSCWEDLKPFYDKSQPGPYSFEELKTKIYIDFSFIPLKKNNLERLNKNSSSPVIYLIKNRKNAYVSESNMIILEYLKSGKKPFSNKKQFNLDK